MKKRSDMAHDEKYTANGVIERGYEIYDEWMGRRLASREIVRYVDRIIAEVRMDRGAETRINGLACLFALDMRIRARYGTLLRCLFLYFSWRREKRMLTLLKRILRISDGVSDVRTAIEIELKKLREQMAEDEIDDADDETRGGKRNGKADEEAATAEEGKDEVTSEDTPNEISDIEEKDEQIEEKADELTEQNPNEESIEDLGEQGEINDAPKQDENNSVKNDGKPLEQKQDEQKVNNDNNGPEESSEPSKDKKIEAKTYNDAIDPLITYSDDAPSEKAEKPLSYVDEVIMDNLAKGKMDYVGRINMPDPDDVDDGPEIEDNNIQRNEDSKKKDKDDHLYDELINSNNDELSAENQGSLKDNYGQINPQGNNSASLDSLKKDFDDLRVPLHIDIENETNNDKRREANNHVTERMVRRIYRQQAAAMREQLTVASAAHGIDAPVEIIGVPDSPKTEHQSIVPNRK